MLQSILLAGVGGQGTILMSKILSEGLMQLCYDVKMSEIHGMSQRGGSVSTQVRFGEKVFSPTIGPGEADWIVSFEKIETLRALPFLREGGRILADEREIYPLPVLAGTAAYPHDALERIKVVTPHLTLVPAAETAERLGSIRAQNIVLLGALVKKMDLPYELFLTVVGQAVPPKARAVNELAFQAGYAL